MGAKTRQVMMRASSSMPKKMERIRNHWCVCITAPSG